MADNPNLPLTGSGDATARVAAADISSAFYQYVKLTDGTSGSTQSIPASNANPTTGMYGLVVRNLPSGTQSVAMASTGTMGGVQVLNPTTAVNVSNPTTAVTVNGTVGLSASTGQIGSVSLLAGSSVNTLGNVTVSNLSTGSAGSTTVDANLSSAGSTRSVGTFNQGSPAGTSADAWWVRTVSTGSAGAGSTTVDANLTTAGGNGLVGLVDGLRFTVGAGTSANSSADVSLLAANANRRGAIIQNASTGTALLVNLSTIAVSSGARYTFQIPANGYAVIGGQTGNFPLYTGAIRGKMNSTAVAGPVYITEFSS